MRGDAFHKIQQPVQVSGRDAHVALPRHRACSQARATVAGIPKSRSLCQTT
jgi:hypothetical protein